MKARQLIIGLSFCGIAVVLVQFQNCSGVMKGTELTSLAIPAIEPDLVDGLKVWHKVDGDLTLPAGPFISEEMTLLAVLMTPPMGRTVVRYDDGTELSEGIAFSFANTLPVTQVSTSVAIFPNRIFTSNATLVDTSKPILIAMQVPKSIQNSLSYIDGKNLIGNSTIVSGDTLTLLGRRLNGTLDETLVKELAIYDRVLSGAEVGSVARAIAERHGIKITLGEFHDVSTVGGAAPTYTADVVPIFTARTCFGCHPGVQPALTTYTPAQLAAAVNSDLMPKNPAPKLTPAEKAIVSAWAQSGLGFN